MTQRQPPEGQPEHGTSFGARLRLLRKEAGLSQQELAERAGLSLNAVNAMERGVRRHPYPHTVRSLAGGWAISEEGRLSLRASVPGRANTTAKVAAAAAAAVPTRASVLEATLPSPPTPLVG